MPVSPELRTANERDACVQRPNHHEVVSTGDPQPGAHGAFARLDLANNLRGLADHLRLDVRALIGKIDQDHVAELKHLDINLNRHRGASLDAETARSARGPGGGGDVLFELGGEGKLEPREGRATLPSS
jgi:hypothetical protein